MRSVSFIIAAAALTLCCVSKQNKPEQVARKYCSTCHSFPDASLLDKQSWRDGVLPEMAFRMGVDFSRLHSIDENDFNAVLNSLPESPMVTKAEWKAIEEYYSNQAPDSLVVATHQKMSTLRQFKADTISLAISGKNLLTLLKYDTRTHKFFVGTRLGKLFALNEYLQAEDSLDVASPPSALLNKTPQTLVLLTMGIMDPNEQRKGKIIQIRAGEQVTLIDSLKRPVYFEETDLNSDGAEDLVVSAFGNYTGGLLAFEKVGNSYRRHVIHNMPGTRKTIVDDFNDDGLPDILTLITQGDEQIALLTNRGNFRFTYRVLLRFPPVYGSSYFELGDFNGDGHSDILYTNGDNADYSPILKPYHGVRVFLNDGLNKFDEAWFFPMNGATMARAVDFDNDGDLDIAAIAFFPDFKKNPEYGFIYFENERGKFTPHYTKLAATSRWITMEVADLDGDQDLDIVLASLNFSPGVPDSLVQAWKENPVSLLMLENTLNDVNDPD